MIPDQMNELFEHFVPTRFHLPSDDGSMTVHDIAQFVKKSMEQALGDDRVKTVVHGFTRLGILEITRKRTGETLQEMLTQPCRACGETGRAPVEWP